MFPRALVPWLVLLGAACPGPAMSVLDGGADAGDAGDGGAVDAGPYDAGLPAFEAASFCAVWSSTSCAWALGCGQVLADEAARCAQLQQVTFCDEAATALDAGRVGFDAGVAMRCLLALEDAKCGALPGSCWRAYPPRVSLGGACAADAECTEGFCRLDGGCGACTLPLPLASACTGAGQCDDAGYCDGMACAPRLDAGVSCVGFGNAACRSGRCAYQSGLGDVCDSKPVPSSCTFSASCPAGWYCDEFDACALRLDDAAACQKDDACKSGACVSGKCQTIAPLSIAKGDACSASWQCAYGLICAGGKCGARTYAGAACELRGLDVFVGCPYRFVCDAKELTCAPLDVYCHYPGYCPGGPAFGEACTSSCRGYSSCATLDAGAFCVRDEALPGEACDLDLANRACAVGECEGTCPAEASGCGS